jgi:endonuclease/exonuclease/phosphatase family metal-dependent hydrolase
LTSNDLLTMKMLLISTGSLIGLIFLAFAIFVVWASREAVDVAEQPRSGIRTVGSDAAPAAPGPLRVVTYNIGYGSGKKNMRGDVLPREEVTTNLDAIAAFLKESNADIIGLQEVDFAADRSFRIDQLDYLQQRLQMPYAAFAITWNQRYIPFPYWPPGAHFGRIISGQAVLSRFPITKHHVRTFAKPENNPLWYNWFYLDRVVQAVTLDVNGAPLTIWHAHLEAFDPHARREQTEHLAHWIMSQPDRQHIALGDFNTVDTQFTEMTGMQSVMAEHRAPTFPSWDPQRKIDYIYYGPPFTASESTTVNAIQASDHLPIISVIARRSSTDAVIPHKEDVILREQRD